MQPVTFPANWYGPSSRRMREILSQVHGIQWLEMSVGLSDRDKILSHVKRHAESLSSLGEDIKLKDVIVLDGAWSVLHQDRWGIDPYNAWGNRWKATDDLLGRVASSLAEVVSSSPDTRRLLRSPLWPIENQSNICGQTLVAHSEIRARRVDSISNGRDRCVAWALLCRAEGHVWNALLWELASGNGLVSGANPFQDLLDMYDLGVFPMGWSADHYEIYAPTA